MNKPKQNLMMAALILALTTQVMANRPERASEEVPAGDYEAMEVSIDFAAGTLDLTGSDMAEPAKLEVYYIPRLVDYDFDYTERGKECHLFIESDIRGRRWDEDDIENEWRLQLSNRLPLDLEMDIGACEGNFDLGGLRLRDLTLDVGAADLEIIFSEPNPIRLRELSVDCGASSLTMDGLANANCDVMDFDIGAGSCELDFRGDIKGETKVSIDVGVGSMDIIVPRGIPLMIRGDDGWFSTLDLSGLDLELRRGDVWVSEGFDEADDRLIFDVSISMGSVVFRGR